MRSLEQRAIEEAELERHKPGQQVYQVNPGTGDEQPRKGARKVPA